MKHQYLTPYKPFFKEGRDSILIPKENYNIWANLKFKKEIESFPQNSIVWLQDKSSKYQGYYLVVIKNGKKYFNFLGSLVSSSIFKKYGVLEKDVPILEENY